MSVAEAYQILYIAVLLALSVLIAVMLVRSVRTKGVMERILCVNMLSTMVICSIAVLSRMLKEPYLMDVALIYAMISFVAVLMLSLTHIPPGPKIRRRFMSDGTKKDAAVKNADSPENGSRSVQPQTAAGRPESPAERSV